MEKRLSKLDQLQKIQQNHSQRKGLSPQFKEGLRLRRISEEALQLGLAYFRSVEALLEECLAHPSRAKERLALAQFQSIPLANHLGLCVIDKTEKELTVYDVFGGLAHRITLPKHDIATLCFHPSGRLLFLTKTTHEVGIFDIHGLTGKLVKIPLSRPEPAGSFIQDDQGRIFIRMSAQIWELLLKEGRLKPCFGNMPTPLDVCPSEFSFRNASHERSYQILHGKKIIVSRKNYAVTDRTHLGFLFCLSAWTPHAGFDALSSKALAFEGDLPRLVETRDLEKELLSFRAQRAKLIDPKAENFGSRISAEKITFSHADYLSQQFKIAPTSAFVQALAPFEKRTIAEVLLR